MNDQQTAQLSQLVKQLSIEDMRSKDSTKRIAVLEAMSRGTLLPNGVRPFPLIIGLATEVLELREQVKHCTETIELLVGGNKAPQKEAPKQRVKKENVQQPEQASREQEQKVEEAQEQKEQQQTLGL